MFNSQGKKATTKRLFNLLNTIGSFQSVHVMDSSGRLGRKSVVQLVSVADWRNGMDGWLARKCSRNAL